MMTFIGAVLLAWLAFEAKAWFPHLLRRIILIAARRLPKREQVRFIEEWSAHLEEVPGGIARLAHALGFIFAAGNMYPRRSAAIKRRRARARSLLTTRAVMRGLDLVLVIPILLFLMPLILVLTLALELSGPPLFSQPRVGRGGRVFHIYKFRTMSFVGSSEAKCRITRVGSFLRRTSLDELPQLFNVLRGDMSLVGPRPYGIVVLDKRGKPYDLTSKELRINSPPGSWTEKPGITGLLMAPGEAPSSGIRQGLVSEVGRYLRALGYTFLKVFRRE